MPKPGKLEANLAHMVEEQIVLAVSVSVQRARKDQGPIAYKNINTQHSGRLSIFVEPVQDDLTSSELYLLTLHPEQEAIPLPQYKEISVDEVAIRRIKALEEELHETRQNLQATVEQLESSNEELQSTNEELIASNEELQSTNEELHSVNEELFSVNHEFQSKIDELEQLTRDEFNLLKATEIGVMYLDSELKVRKFTPSIGDAFNLLNQDLGRPIAHITHTIKFPDLLKTVNNVLESRIGEEMEVESLIGDRFLLRILPYEGIDGQHQGVLLTFININLIKNLRETGR